MDIGHLKLGIAGVALSVALAVAPACSASQETNGADAPSEDMERIHAILDAVPENEVTRFILTVPTTKSAEANVADVQAVLDSLKDADAKAEWLEGSPVIFVTGTKAAIYRALDTGYVSSVQIDRLKPPLKK